MTFALQVEPGSLSVQASTLAGWVHIASGPRTNDDTVVSEVVQCLRDNDLPRSVLTDGACVDISDASAIRLALVFLVVDGSPHAAVAAAELRSMSMEETYYWYAKVHHPRGRKALAVLVGAVDE